MINIKCEKVPSYLVAGIIVIAAGFAGCMESPPDKPNESAAGQKVVSGNENKYSLTAPNGLSFAGIKGYENWHLVASHYRTDRNEIRFILGNTETVDSYKDGGPFQDGAILVKIGYTVKENPDYPDSVEPDVLQRVEYMIKGRERFNSTGGWGYARFIYNATTDTYTPYGKNETFANECYTCHTIVKRKDYVFTDYVER